MQLSQEQFRDLATKIVNGIIKIAAVHIHPAAVAYLCDPRFHGRQEVDRKLLYDALEPIVLRAVVSAAQEAGPGDVIVREHHVKTAQGTVTCHYLWFC